MPTVATQARRKAAGLCIGLLRSKGGSVLARPMDLRLMRDSAESVLPNTQAFYKKE